ncbi:MAG: hypothetical protein RLZZ352_2688 [Pseudomonadota bacterium]|jgi:hypothetical protein
MTDNLQNLSEAAIKEAIRIEEDCIFSAKSHFNASDVWLHRHYYIGVPATLLGAAAGAAFVKNQTEFAAIFSLVSTILTGLTTFLKPSEKASLHKSIGDQYLSLRNDARIFREIEISTLTKAATIQEGVKSLSKRRSSLNQGSPQIPRKAFEKARLGIEQGEAKYAADN